YDFVQSPMHEVRYRVMPLNRPTTRRIHGKLNLGPDGGRIFFRKEMKEGITAFLSIDDVPKPAASNEFARVAHLTPHFGIGSGDIEDHGHFALKACDLQDLR